MDLPGRLRQLPHRLIGDPVQRALAPYQVKLEAVNAAAAQLERETDAQLRSRALDLKGRAGAGDTPEQMLVDLFALVREVAHRTIGLRPFDVQILGGLGLHDGRIVQMGTGEGKTLAAVSPVALHALCGRGVHVLTFNDYLARRDAEWMGPIYRFLGLTVAFIRQGMRQTERRNAYAADVTYLTAKEAGFDFLRDGLAYDVSQLVQRAFQLAIVDEADSILIDEARVPLVIAGLTDPQQRREDVATTTMRAVVQRLDPDAHFTTDEYRRHVYLTEEGASRAEELLGCGELYSPANLHRLTQLNLALHAQVLMRRDVDYIVRNDRVEIVDEFTGRVVEDRHWPDGLQAAIEAKEGVRPSDEGRILGSITLQHFLRRYPHLCGMTATAEPASDELFGFYGLEVLAVPPNRSCVRIDHPDLVFTHKEAKRCALLAEIEQVHRTGRPILVGTLTVEESEALATDLRAEGITCDILNARRDAEEARIIAEAGNIGAVTISTNMAGRGVDIRLGGSEGQEYEQVAALGGLYVIGTNRHESRRVDDQLRGRAGRQGDPGSSRFIISLEDELLMRYGIDDLIPARWRPPTQMEPVDNPVIRREVARAQRIIEGQNYEIRRTLWRYSRFVEQQRRMISERRRPLLNRASRPTLLQEQAPAAYERARQALAEAELHDLETRLTLQAIDECWSEYLATVTEIRDGIHLAQVGGLSPFDEFVKQAAACFDGALDSIDPHVLDRFSELRITADGIDKEQMDQMGLRGPSSTWTYLINDDAFTDGLAATLMGRQNIGFAANAAVAAPLLMLWAVSRRLQRRK
jgi:preprotein translocase subunit SecA